MSIYTSDIDWTQLINFTSNGLVIASFSEIRDAVTKRFKEIYGSDIDVSTASADGIYIENFCLIINNMLLSIKNMYQQLDVTQATGKSLENLCALSNITRRPATASTARLALTLDEFENEYSTNNILFSDKNGNIWQFKSDENITFVPGEEQQVTVSCLTLGPVKADRGWIDKLLSNDVNLLINQLSDAELGSFAETDEELRARRSNLLSSNGNSVLENLASALGQINGITDIKIYNNNTNNNEYQSLDGTTVPIHSIYIVLRQDKNITISPSQIGTTIFNKMTPGIHTVASVETEKSRSYNFKQYILGEPVSDVFSNIVNWKECQGVNPSWSFTIHPISDYFDNSENNINRIGNELIYFLNHLPISYRLTQSELIQQILGYDKKFKSNSTYQISINDISNVDILNNANVDEYFNYLSVSYNTNIPGQITITISGGE